MVTRLRRIQDAASAFTLIELMIVVAIIGILAAIAVPKFADLVTKAKEGATKGSLGALRSALSIYYADMEGLYPATLAALNVQGKFIATIPVAKVPNYHGDSSSMSAGSPTAAFTDAGGWAYDNTSGD